MPLLDVVLFLIVVGILLYLVNRFIPMESSIKSILNVVVVIAVVVWVLQAFGLWSGLSTFRVGR
jgi:undecaprenyl pyrophosphate phosphatase UppP